MYCPVCFNDTLKLATSGVGKLSFNNKSKTTSQFFFNINQDSSDDINKKITTAVDEYFEYYTGFHNKDLINEVKVYSSDFKCSQGCSIRIDNKLNIVNLIVSPQDVLNILEETSHKYSVPIDINSIRSSLQ